MVIRVTMVDFFAELVLVFLRKGTHVAFIAPATTSLSFTSLASVFRL